MSSECPLAQAIEAFISHQSDILLKYGIIIVVIIIVIVVVIIIVVLVFIIVNNENATTITTPTITIIITIITIIIIIVIIVAVVFIIIIISAANPTIPCATGLIGKESPACTCRSVRQHRLPYDDKDRLPRICNRNNTPLDAPEKMELNGKRLS